MRRDTLTLLLDETGATRALSVPVYLLRVVKGPDRRKQKRVASSRAVIGAGPGADLELSDPTISSVHCEISAHAEGFRVTDLGSKNGVLLCGRRVREAWLEPKDDLELGETVVRFEIQSERQELPLSKRSSFGGLRGSSAAMRAVYEQLASAASSEAAVLLCGETGTGKELAADALVSQGPRAERPLVVVDCARLPAGTAESELFGHEKGAFTGASSARAGAFERAHGGTVFLDEVGELPLELQPKLLGALERKMIQRVGGQASIAVDIRVISATHRELEREVNRGAFRADLYYRLAALQIRLPSLAQRREDIPELVAHFASDLPGALAPDALAQLFSGDYPGNVRQLRNAVERAALGFEEMPPAPTAVPIDTDTPFRIQKERLLKGFEHAFLTRLLEVCGDNITEASRRSGISRVHLHNMLHRLGLRDR